ncbi:NUDIX domain-containing protein [Halorhodospira halochloris]|uniref:ADP-ribose pyrophosphatase n=1 Tax=Halorhodospira halochloris TaxID=1052 RepID=A0A0X8XA53_HALHR|nr:NUDIX domain-containing protein [Halorhodospira halochloris]MBK1652007.1 ADP-ribose diphosphatase [Halorhodospira halochloris]MCG5530891.1 NUDIX domain-containing protein [Halorhodospira halochloris]MCG5547895.1 NUDIX domain-containing protein [Halorhodospira halochloris]BAU58305.1 ADP-ribose pyrophosphatase [Halorhodospira halochloris]
MAHRYEILQRECFFKGAIMSMERIRLRHALFAGGMTPELTRECLVRDLAVAVLPYDPERDEVVLVEQFRVGCIDDPRGAWLIETVAGIAEAGEEPRSVAYREAQEEAGLEISDLELIADYLPSPGGSTERVMIYCGRCDSSQAGGVHGLAGENEDILSHVLGADEAIEQALSGGMRSAMPIIALQWLALNRQRLRKEWTGGSWSESLWTEEDQ